MPWTLHTNDYPKQVKSEPARTFTESLGVGDDELICSACRKDITRCLANSEHTPRWMADRDQNNLCCVVGCDNVVLALLNKPLHSIQKALQQASLRTCNDDIPIPVPLCKHHYHLVYNILQSSQTHCGTCKASLKHSPKRVCPNPS